MRKFVCKEKKKKKKWERKRLEWGREEEWKHQWQQQQHCDICKNESTIRFYYSSFYFYFCFCKVDFELTKRMEWIKRCRGRLA